MRLPPRITSFWRRPGAAGSAPSDGAPQHPLQRFHRGLGNLAVTRDGTLWYGAGRFSLVTFPSNQRVAATKRDVQRLLVDCGRLAAVFCPVTGSGAAVTEYRLHDKGYGPDRLQHQFRSHVRKHARQFVARELTWDEMSTGAVTIHADIAARRRGTAPAMTDARQWAQVCEDAKGMAGLSAYGCLVGPSLAGYVVAWRERDVCHGVLINRDSRFDALRTGNVLLHSFSRDRIGRADTSSINLGRGWYPPQPSLDSFKRHAGYEERETTLAVVLHPWAEPLLRGSWTHRCLGRIRSLTGGRLDLASDLELLEAARLTRIP